MSEQRFGGIVGDEDTGGLLDPHRAVLLDDYATLAMPTVQVGQNLPGMALRLSGRVKGSGGNTLDATFVMSILDAGVLVHELNAAVERLADAEASSDFRVGVALGKEATS